MFDCASLLIFISVTAFLVATPGPNTFYIITRSIQGGYHAGIASCAGRLLATLVHIAAAASGLSLIVLSSPSLFNFIKYAGAGYLIWIGAKTIVSKSKSETMAENGDAKYGSIIRHGFLVNLLNPKTALFFLAFLPQFVNPSIGGVTHQFVLLGSILAVVGTTSDSIYVLLAGTVGKWLRNNLTFFRSLRYVAGSVYLSLGVAAAFGIK